MCLLSLNDAVEEYVFIVYRFPHRCELWIHIVAVYCGLVASGATYW